jgi:lysine-specific demethylase 3
LQSDAEAARSKQSRNHKLLQNAKKRKRDVGKESMRKKLNKVDKEQKQFPSTKDETLDKNNMVSCSFFLYYVVYEVVLHNYFL